MGPIRTEHRDELVHIVSGHRVLLLDVFDAPRLPQARAIRRAQESFRARLGDQGVAFCTVIRSGTPVLEPRARQELIELSADYGRRSLCNASLVLVDGFAGVAVRAILSTLHLVSRETNPARVFADRRPTEAWLLERIRAHDPRITAREVKDVFDFALERPHGQAPAPREL